MYKESIGILSEHTMNIDVVTDSRLPVETVFEAFTKDCSTIGNVAQ